MKNNMSLSFDFITFKRISENLRKDSFYFVDHNSGDYIIYENYAENPGDTQDISVNVSQILGMDLSLEKYKIFRYGKENAKKEESCFALLKGQDAKSRKADITLLIFDNENNKIYLVCGEVKKTFKEANFADAREQLISSHIDLNIFNAMLSFNYFPIERYFFIVFEKNKLIKAPHSSSAILARSDSDKKIPFNLLREEYERKKIHFNLDDSRLINQVDKDISKLNDSLMLSADLKFILSTSTTS